MTKQSKIIDLSMTIYEGMQVFDAHWHPKVKIAVMGSHEKENRETRRLVIGTHTGTHMDAPRHFIRNGETVEHISLTQLVGPATVVNFSELPDRQEIQVDDLIGAIGDRPRERVIVRFDWDQYFNSPRYYRDHPYFSEKACHWLVDQGCRLVALDTPQPDNPVNGFGSDNDAPNHRILLGNGVIIVEYLINIKEISRPEVTLVVAPLKIQEGDGAPVRCFVIEDGEG